MPAAPVWQRPALMMLSPFPRPFALFLAAGLAAVPLAPVAMAQAEEALFVATDKLQEGAAPAAPEKSRSLLDEVTRNEMERQIALKQTELERLKQDQEKTERDAAAVQKTIDSMAALINESGDEVTKLSTESRRLEHELAVSEARIAAERLKAEGLRALSAAQAKSLSALARHAEESEARAQLRAAELNLLKAGKPIPAETRDESTQTELGKCRKALAVAVAKTELEERGAREAMKAAAAKMALAEAKESTAKRLVENDLTLPPVADKPKSKSEKAAEKRESDPPVRKTASAASSTPKPTPKPVAASRSSTPPPRGPFFGR